MSIGWTRGWNNYLKSLEKEGIDFGHNCWDDSADTRRKLTKLEKMGAEVLINIADEGSSPYNIKVKLPSSFIELDSDGALLNAAESDSEVLMYILTKMPPASSVQLKTKREGEALVSKTLDMEWHW